MKLKFKRDKIGIYNKLHKEGDIIDVQKWDDQWQGMDLAERESKGIFVICYGRCGCCNG